MPAPDPKLLLIDPLTMLGRELGALLPSLPALAHDLHLLHTGTEEEHQIAEVAGAAALVPPLRGPEDLEGFAAVVVASEADTPRLDHLAAHIKRWPQTPMVVLRPLSRFGRRLPPAAGLPGETLAAAQVRVAHPAAVAAVHVLAPLRHLEPVSVTVAAVEPVSAFGGDAVEVLATQAARRLQGGESEEAIAGRTLAFNLVTLDSSDLRDELTALLPDLAVAATRSVLGVFHGHLAHLAIHFGRACTLREIEAAWEEAPGLTMAEHLAFNDVTERDQVVISRPQLSRDGRTAAVTVMVDGLRVGGATTALRILASMLAIA